MNRLTARGAGIIMISSELPELLGMSDRILVMHRGRICRRSSPRAMPPRSGAAARRWGWPVDERRRHGQLIAHGASVRHARRTAGCCARCCGSLTPHFLTVSNLLNVVEQTSINADRRRRA